MGTLDNLPTNFTHRVTDERLEELIQKQLSGYSYNEFVMNFGEWFSMGCELLAYRKGEKVKSPQKENEMNLLEKMKMIAEGNKMALEDSPDICRAVLAAMDEIERDQLKSGNWDTQNGMVEALSILREHLEVKK